MTDAPALDPMPATGGVASGHGITFTKAVRVWAHIALLSFGGPAGQIAVMHHILVEEKRWIGEDRFVHALNFCMLLPGPEAQQLAIYIGWLLHKAKGGLIAGTLFVLPGAAAIMTLSWIYVLYGGIGPVFALFFGLKAAVLAIVLQAVVRIGHRAIGNRIRLAVASAAFLGIFLCDIPFPLIVLVAGLIGYFFGRAGHQTFAGAAHAANSGGAVSDAESALGTEIPLHARPSAADTVRLAAILLLCWLTPVALLAAGSGAFGDIAIFFSKMAVVTFGGAYAVLAYVAQAAVDQYRWLSPTEMLDGLGLAETTPGPLIMVTQFVGFLGAYRNPAGLPPLLAGTLGGLLTSWVTFVPCFLWIFLGAPFIERLRENRALAGALAAISAAVTGVILNLAIWFALHFIFRRIAEQQLGPISIDLPNLASIDPLALMLAAAALVAMFRFRIGVLWTLSGCAFMSMMLHTLLG